MQDSVYSSNNFLVLDNSRSWTFHCRSSKKNMIMTMSSVSLPGGKQVIGLPPVTSDSPRANAYQNIPEIYPNSFFSLALKRDMEKV